MLLTLYFSYRLFISYLKISDILVFVVLRCYVRSSKYLPDSIRNVEFKTKIFGSFEEQAQSLIERFTLTYFNPQNLFLRCDRTRFGNKLILISSAIPFLKQTQSHNI